MSWTLWSVAQLEIAGLSTDFSAADSRERRAARPGPRSCDRSALRSIAMADPVAPATATPSPLPPTPPGAVLAPQPLALACTPGGLAFAGPLARTFGTALLRVSVAEADPLSRVLIGATDLALVLRPARAAGEGSTFAADFDAVSLGVFIAVLARHPAPRGIPRPARTLVPRALWQPVRSCGILGTQPDAIPSHRVTDPGRILERLRTHPQARGVFSLGAVPAELEVLEIDGVPPSLAAFEAGDYPFGLQVWVVSPRDRSPNLGAVVRFLRDGRGQRCLPMLLPASR